MYVPECMATLYTVSVGEPYSNVVLETIVNLYMNNESSFEEKQDWSVSHRGVPIWLLNTGINPRRPCKQLKFTLAEKGTGFILWQDRIDMKSDFKIFQKKANGSYGLFENLINSNSNRSCLITFKASDRKTLVFVKFAINAEISKFFNYYLQMNKKYIEELRSRAKSLPIGIGSNQMNKRNENWKLQSLSIRDDIKKKDEIQNFLNENKYRRLSKSDISNPCSPRHIINLKLAEKDSFYTLSKLLPQKLIRNEKRSSVFSSPSFSPSSTSTTSSTCSSSMSPK